MSQKNWNYWFSVHLDLLSCQRDLVLMNCRLRKHHVMQTEMECYYCLGILVSRFCGDDKICCSCKCRMLNYEYQKYFQCGNLMQIFWISWSPYWIPRNIEIAVLPLHCDWCESKVKSKDTMSCRVAHIISCSAVQNGIYQIYELQWFARSSVHVQCAQLQWWGESFTVYRHCIIITQSLYDIPKKVFLLNMWFISWNRRIINRFVSSSSSKTSLSTHAKWRLAWNSR